MSIKEMKERIQVSEKSSYIQETEIKFFNLDNFKPKDNAFYMIDLFCGAGGFSLGAEWAGFNTVLGIDHFKPAIETWSKNHINSIGCLGDIKKIDPMKIKKLLKQKNVEKIHLITAGVPCQGFSLANRKRTDNDERNFLFLEFIKFVKSFSPDYIILENVSGIKSSGSGFFVKNIILELEKLDYNVSVKTVNAADFGVPQTRNRILFVGVKKKVGLLEPYLFPAGKYENNHRTVYDAISDLPVLENNEVKYTYDMDPLTEYQKLMRGFGNMEKISKPTILKNHRSPNHPKDTIEKIKNTRPGEPMYDRFKQRIRLKSDKPSPTQLAGGIRPQFQFGHPSQNRGLSIRERARIQSFPDSYEFCGGIVQERVQTGNAVPPLLIYELVKPIIKTLK